MRRGFFLAVTCFMAYAAAAQTHNYRPALMQTTAISFIVAEQLVNEPVNSVQKKRTLKERIQAKIFKNILKKKTTDADQKKKIKLLGLFSILAALAGPFVALLAFASATPWLFVAAGFAFCLTAIILGFVSLKWRKKMTDKTGTSKTPALIGIILGALFILLPLIYLIGFAIAYAG